MVKENKSDYELYETPSTSRSRQASGHLLRRRRSSQPKSETSKEILPPPEDDEDDTERPRHDHVDPSVVSNPATVLKIDPEHNEIPPEKCFTRCKRFLYDKENKKIMGRTCKSWGLISLYSIMYLIAIITFTLMLVLITLLIIKKNNSKALSNEHIILQLKYSPDSVEITGTPLAEHSFPLIWYRSGVDGEYTKYVSALDEMLHNHNHNNRPKRQVRSSLGPCGQRPYGYGDKPCVLVKIDQQKNWVGKPLKPDSPRAKNAPTEVQKWIEGDSTKYWLHCAGNHNYDREHLGKIVYYPDPPGFDSSLFPMDENSTSQVIAVQVANFTSGISLTVECKLWFEDGFTSFVFMLLVLP